MKSKRWRWVVAVIILVAVVLRFYKLAAVPMGLYYDEIDLGYQARSLLETGKDYRGGWSPFFVRSFNSDKTPIPVYLSIPAALIFKIPELQVRATTALVGVAVVGLAMVLTWIWTKKRLAAVVVGLSFAVSPWLVQFSRIAFEAIYVLLFYMGFLIFFYRWLSNKRIRDYYVAILLLALGVYVYRIMSFYVPMTFLLLLAIYRKEIVSVGGKHLLGGAVLAGVLILPFLQATTIKSADQPRIAQISITSDPTVPIWVQRNREVDSGDYKTDELGNKAVWSSFWLHNKPLGWFNSLKNNYFKSWSSAFLFAEGDPNLRQGVGKMGALLTADMAGLVAGGYWLIRKIKEKKYQFLMAWLVTAPLPADLTVDGAFHASRLIIFAAPLLITVGLGWWRITNRLWRMVKGNRKVMGVVGLGIIVGSWTVGIGIFVHRYWVHFPLESASWHGYGYKEAMVKIKEVEADYDEVWLTETLDPPILYYLFWANVPPGEVQKYGPAFTVETEKGQRLDKFRVVPWGKVADGYDMPVALDLALRSGVLYLATQQDLGITSMPRQTKLPNGVKVIATIPYPDKLRTAFFVVARGD